MKSTILQRCTRLQRTTKCLAGILFVYLIVIPRHLAAQTTLGSQVLDESGSQISSGTTQLTFSEGQPVIGDAQSGTTDMGIGFISALTVQIPDAFPPAAANPPFSMVGQSSLTVNWQENGNLSTALYIAQISTTSNFSPILASSQTFNLNATFSGLAKNTSYYLQAAAYSNSLSTWTAYAFIGTTFTLATPPGPAIGISTFTGWSPSGFTLNWSSGTVAQGYNPAGTLYLTQISTSSNFTIIAASSQTANLSATFASLTEYVNYYARVQAVNGDGVATAFTLFGSTFTGSPFIYPALINTIGGNGSYLAGGDGGPAVDAAIGIPHGVTLDGTGNVYVADYWNARIRKIDSTGVITTLSSSVTPLDIFYYGGSLYFTTINQYLQKLAPDGTITTIAGTGVAGYNGDEISATTAMLNGPEGLSIDASGNIYVADQLNCRIRMIDTAGIIHTVAGSSTCGYSGDNGPATAATLSAVTGIAVDDMGDSYIAVGTAVRKVDTSGIITTYASIGATRISVGPDHSVYVSDGGSRVRRIDPNGNISVLAGGGSVYGDGGPAPAGNLNQPLGLAASALGSVYVADSQNSRIREVSVATTSPAVPTLSTSGATLASISWDWNRIDHPAAYLLKTSSGNFLSGVLSNRASFYTEVGLSTNTSYAAELVEINSAGTSTSAVVTGWTAADTPGTITILSVTTASASMSWNPATNPSSTNFEVSYTTSAGFAVGSDISTAALTTSSFTTVTSLLGQSTYYFRVRAYNGGGYATAFAPTVSTWTAVYQSSVASVSQSTGTPGVAFTISGSGFGNQYAGTTDVRFGVGGSTAPILSWSDTAIAVEVPLISTGAYGLLVERQGTVFTSVSAGTFTVVIPAISTITPTFGAAGMDISGTGFGNYVDSFTTQVTLDGTSIGLSSWTDTLIRGVAPASMSLGTHTALVVISTNIGTVQSNAFVVNITAGMRGAALIGLAGQRVIWPPLYYQGLLHLKASTGGNVIVPSRASVSVPPGALAADTYVSLQHADLTGADKNARDEARLTGGLGDMGEPIEFGPEGTQFRQPVTITLPYDPVSVPFGRATELAVYYWDRTANAWTALRTDVDTINHLLVARTDHFSLYQPLLSGMTPAAAASPEFRYVDVYAFPNPARRNHVVTIRSQVGLADEVDVHIYDLSGHLVHSAAITSSQILDDGNGKGLQYTFDDVWDTGGVGSGVYFFAITAKKSGSDSIRKTGKVGVIK